MVIRQLYLYIYSVAWLLACISCAKVGDPLPPLSGNPIFVKDLELSQVGNTVRLEFSLALDRVGRVEVYRLCEPPTEGRDPHQKMRSVEVSDLIVSRNRGKLELRDELNLFESCNYGLRAIDLNGGRSILSNTVRSEPILPAKPPTNLAFKILGPRVILNWTPPIENIDGSRPPRIIGYLVNSRHFVSRPKFVDEPFQVEEKLSYIVQTVSRRHQPLILSNPSNALSVIPQGTFSPNTPNTSSTLSIKNGVQLGRDADE